jgi:hypothetical protein
MQSKHQAPNFGLLINSFLKNDVRGTAIIVKYRFLLLLRQSR